MLLWRTAVVPRGCGSCPWPCSASQGGLTEGVWGKQGDSSGRQTSVPHTRSWNSCSPSASLVQYLFQWPQCTSLRASCPEARVLSGKGIANGMATMASWCTVAVTATASLSWPRVKVQVAHSAWLPLSLCTQPHNLAEATPWVQQHTAVVVVRKRNLAQPKAKPGRWQQVVVDALPQSRGQPLPQCRICHGMPYCY